MRSIASPTSAKNILATFFTMGPLLEWMKPSALSRAEPVMAPAESHAAMSSGVAIFQIVAMSGSVGVFSVVDMAKREVTVSAFFYETLTTASIYQSPVGFGRHHCRPRPRSRPLAPTWSSWCFT